MQLNDKEAKRGTIDCFFRSSSFKKKKLNASNPISMIDRSIPSSEPDPAANLSSNNRSELSTSSIVPNPSSSSSSVFSCTTSHFPSTISPSSSPSFPASASISSPSPSATISPEGPVSPSSLLVSLSLSSQLSPVDQTSPSSQCSPSHSSSTVVRASDPEDPHEDLSDISRSPKERPTQPKLSSYRMNKDNRSFRSAWFSTFPWLEYSIKLDFAFCYYCRHFTDGSNLLTRNQSDAFISGYSNWKNALTKNQGFVKHESSTTHKYAFIAYQEYVAREKSQASVINVIEKSRVESIRRNRQRLTKIASALLLCSRQLISLRGHNENVSSNNRGNFIEILKWASTSDPLVNSIFADSAENATYLSPLIQNELIHLMANQIRFQIAEKVRRGVFALMADEAKDCSGDEQLSVVLRFVSDESIAQNEKTSDNQLFKECFVGLVRLKEFDAHTLANEILKYLSFLEIDASKCIALCFDGAAVMSGKNAGVQAILRSRFMLKAIYVHCYAHKLNLVVCDVSKVVPYMSEFYAIVSRINTYFHSSSVTNESFRVVQERLMIENKNSICLKTWCETRWDSRWSSINALIENYQVLMVCFEELMDEGHERSLDARALSSALKVPMFVVTLFILHQLFGIIKVLSDQLKAKFIDFYHAQDLIKSVVKQIGDLRSEAEFTKLYSKIKEFSNDHHIDITSAPRPRRKTTVSTRLDNSFILSTIGIKEVLTDEEKFRTNIYYPVIDSILVELNNRFSNENMEILDSMSALFPGHNNFLNINVLRVFSSHVDVDLSALHNEILVLKPMLKCTKLQSIIDLYFKILPLKEAFPTMLSLIISAMTIPVSSTTCERTFSKMKLIKTTARNTMSDSRLSDLCVLAVERDFDVNFDRVIDDFAKIHQNSRILLK